MPTSPRAVDAESCSVRTGSTSAERVAVDRRRGSAKARDGVAPFNSRGQKVPIFTAPRPRKESKTIGFDGVLWVLSVAGDRKYPAGGIYRHKGCAGRNPPATALPWPWGTGRRIATGAARPRNDKGFCKECGCIIDGAVGGQPQGSPQRKIRVIFSRFIKGAYCWDKPGWGGCVKSL